MWRDMWHRSGRTAFSQGEVLFADAVRLVDRQQTHVEAGEEAPKGVRVEALGSHEEDVDRPSRSPLDHGPSLCAGLARAQMRRT